MVVRDFNVPEVSWDWLCCGSSRNSEILFDVMLACDLTQVVLECTPVKDKCQSTLDLVFVGTNFDNCTVSVEEGMSDHKLVYFCCELFRRSHKKSAPTSMVKHFSRADDESVLDILDLSFSDFNDSDVVSLWNKSKDMCNYCLERFISNRTVRARRTTPWITRSIIHIKRKLKRLNKKKSNSSSVPELSNELSRQLREAKHNYFSGTLTRFLRQDPDRFWRFLTEAKKPIKKLCAIIPSFRTEKKYVHFPMNSSSLSFPKLTIAIMTHRYLQP